MARLPASPPAGPGCPASMPQWDRLSGSSGQASVELVALLPLLAAVALGLLQLLAAGAAREVADAAAEAGAVALLQDRDPREAARASLPGWSRERSTIRVRGRAVRVEVRPRGPVPALLGGLTAGATADAGPVPR